MKKLNMTTLGSLAMSSLILLGSVFVTPVDARNFRRSNDRTHHVRSHKDRPSHKFHRRMHRRMKHYRQAHRRAHQRYRAFHGKQYRRAAKWRQHRMKQYGMKRYKMRQHRREARADRREFRRDWREFRRHRDGTSQDNPGFGRGRGEGRGGADGERDGGRRFRQNRGGFGQN